MSELRLGKHSINLLQAELFPKQALLTLKRVVLSWFLLVITMISAVIFTQYQITVRSNELVVIENIKNKQNQLVSQLENQLIEHKPDSELANKLATLKLLITNKNALYKELTNENSTYVAGFAKAMTDLSDMHSTNVSLQRVVINHDQMTFSGMAKSPESVPAWLAQFESSTVLSGKVFSHFRLSENDSNYTDFVVSTTANEVN